MTSSPGPAPDAPTAAYRPDVLPTNRSGHSRGVYDVAAIRPVVEELLLDDDARGAARRQLGQFAPVPGAADRVAAVLDEMLAESVR